MDEQVKILLQQYAEYYETADFLQGDPSWFMHQVESKKNKEVMAFIASSLSYGSRAQFLPKIEQIMLLAEKHPYEWITKEEYKKWFCKNDKTCFYRLYNKGTMHSFFAALQELLADNNTIGEYVKNNANTGFEAIDCLCRFFSQRGVSQIIPKDTSSTCKRLCMFLRWMVRDNSPVDLGLWSGFIDKKTLIIPMDTHVMQQAQRLKLIDNKTATMTAAKRLTNRLLEAFPQDPLKGDFALFGYGVNKGN